MRKKTGDNFPAAKSWARGWLGWAEDYRPDPTAAAKRRREREAKQAREAEKEAADEARRIAEARDIWTQSGTLKPPGKTYLESTRLIGAHAWPHDTVRWSDRERAVVVAVTDDAGEVVAVQMVAVTPEGLKDNDRWPTKGGAKQTRGPHSRGAVRLPGPAEGPLCIAEGPETGLTVWAAKGYQTFILLGGLRRAADFAIPGRRIVLCRDDDPKGHPSIKAGNAGGDVRDAWPFSTRRHNKDDFNTLAQESGLDAVRERIDLAVIDEPALGEFLLPLDRAERRIGEVVGAFFDLAAGWKEGAAAPVHAQGVTVGTGKTRAALHHAGRTLPTSRARGDERAVVVAVPEHHLSAEVADRFKAMAAAEGLDLKVEVWRGRQARRPDALDDGRMCAELETVQAAQRLAVDIDKEVCAVCPKREGCAYLAQRGLDADLWVVADQALFREPPKPIARRGIAALVVDESPWQAGLIGVEGRGVEVPLDALEPGVLPTFAGLDGERLVDIRARLALALRDAPNGPVSRATLEAIGFDDKTGRQAWALEWQRKVTTGPWRERTDNADLGRMAALWLAVEALMAPGGPERSGWLTVGHREDDKARVIRVTGRQNIADKWKVPTLATDAVLDVELLRPYWPAVEAKGELKVRAPHQVIRQATGKSYAKGRLAADDASGERARRKLRAQILRRVRELGAEGRTVVIGNKSVVERLDLPAGVVDTAHFNAIAGRDKWKDARLVVIVGRPMPRPSAVERMAAALTGAAVETIPDFYDLGEAFRLKRTARGVERIPAQRDMHPDPTADRILRRIVEGELTQAIGRARGVRRGPDNPVEVLVFGDAILAEPVDEFLTDDDLAVTPADLMLAAGGVAFDEPLAAATAYPDLWPSPAAAKKALQRESWGTNPYERFLYGNVPQVARVAFQREGVGQKHQLVTVDLRRVPNPRAALERLVGPLAHFEFVDGAAAAPEPEVEVVAPAVFNSRVEPEPEVEASAEPMVEVAEVPGETVEPVVEVEVVAGLDPPAEPIVVAPEPEDVVIDWPFVRARAADCELRLGDVARAVGVSPSHFRNMQTGFRKATPKLAAGLERFFATTPARQGRLL